MEKKLNLKKLLATASAFAVIAGASSSAMGGNRVSTADNVIIGGANTNLDAQFVEGDNVTSANVGHITFTTGADLVFGAANGGLDSGANNAPVVFNINHSVTLAGANDFGTGNNGLTLTTVNAGTSTFGQDYSGDVTVNAGSIEIKRNLLAGVGAAAGDLILNGGSATIGGTVANDVTVNAGSATVSTVGRNVLVNGTGKVRQSGAITAGTLTVAAGGLFEGSTTATDVAGAVSITTTDTGLNTIRDAAAAVALVNGNLEMRDATGAADVTVTKGNLIMRNAAQDLLVNGGTVSANTITRHVVVDNVANLSATATVNAINGNATVSNGGTLSVLTTIGGNVLVGKGALSVGGTITGTVDGIAGANNTGVLTLTGNGEVTGKVGTANAVHKIVVKGETKFTSANAVNATTIALEGANAVVNLVGGDLANTNVTSDDSSNMIKVAVDQVLAGDIGSVETPINFMFTADKTITVKTANFHANVQTNTNDTGNVDFNVADTSALSIGSSTARVLTTTFSKDAKVVNGLFSKKVDVVAAIKATLGGIIRTDDDLANGGIRLLAASEVIFSDGADVDSIVIANAGAGNTGEVKFLGDATIRKIIGGAAGANAVNTVDFGDAAGKTVKLGADVFANGIVSLKKSTVMLTKDVTTITAAGIVSLTDGTLDLNNKQLVSAGAGGITFAGGNNMLKVKTQNTGGTVTGGNINLTAGDITFGDKLNVVVDDSAMLRSNLVANSNYTLLNAGVAAKNLVTADKFNVSTVNANSFFKWEVGSITANGVTTLKVSDNSKVALNSRLTNASAEVKENIGVLAGQAAGSDGSKFIDSLQPLNNNETEDAFNRLEVVRATDSIQSVSTATADGLATRTMSLAGDQAVAAVAAGDDHARFGAWFSPFFGQTTQKTKKGNAGYKDDSFGASLGFDTKANDDLIIGAAFTSANSKLKHKNAKSGDKTTVNSFLLSIYSMQQITDSWFAHGSATFGNSEVTNKEKRRNGSVFETATGKYSSMSFNADATVGYNVVTNEATFTPMAGLRYTRVNDGGYKETGTSFQNLDVSKKASNKFELVFGARVSAPTMDMEGFAVTPEAHAFVSHDFIGKNAKPDVRLGGAKLATKSNSVVKTRYNMGLGVNAEYGMMEYGAGYDFDFADKSTGHKGTLRLRVNF